MPADPQGRTSPYEAEVSRRVTARAPLGFAVFLTCVALSSVFEIVRFPERRGWMSAFACGFVLLVAIAWLAIQRRPAWTVTVLILFANVVGVALNSYHAIVGASLAMCVWTLTGLIAASALLIPWGTRNQALACLGTLLSYPLHLEVGTADPLTWAAGGTYLLVVISLSVFGASLFSRSIWTDVRLNATLSEREARLQSYFDLSLVGAAILTPDARAVEVNDELCRMTGYGRVDLGRMSWLDLFHPDERAAAAEFLGSALAKGGAPRSRDMRLVRADGETLHAILLVRGLPGPDAAVDHVMALVQDITERKRTEAEREEYLARAEKARSQAEEASRAKDAFLATVSHELRTPLTPILAWSGALRLGVVDPEQRSAALAAIQRNARAQARLIDDLLDVSRIISGDWRVALRPVALGAVVRGAVDVVRPAADLKGVTLMTSVPHIPVPVQGDPERLQQVVWNLVSNGVKFTPRGGTVAVSVEREADHARIVVRDTGAGISPDFLPHVFERFRQEDSSSTRRHGGLGLGLAIVRALVERHGGTVHAESAGLGKGSTFTVHMPLLIETAPEVGEGERTKEASAEDTDAAFRVSLDGLRVLVVDDDVDSNAVVGALLASCGAEVRTAVSTAEALAVAGRWPPDVLVSDIAMPGEDGCALLRKLRAREGHVPAVALTAYTGKTDRARVLDAGFEDYVAKPFDPTQLARAIERAAHTGPASVA
jgi:PAS domain S-box-containing protein